MNTAYADWVGQETDIGALHSGGGGATAQSGTRAGPPTAGWLLFAAGVVLPAISLLFEIVSGFCAAISFDPIPTVWHMLLVACVPTANAYAWLTLRRQDHRHISRAATLNALAVGVSLCYAFALLPLSPFACLAVAVAGVGLIALAPALALVAALVLRRKLRTLAASVTYAAFPRAWPGVAAGLAALLLLGVPKLTTFAGVEAAMRAPTRSAGVRFLRSYGNREELLRLCFPAERPLAPLGLVRSALTAVRLRLPVMREILPDDARKLYYRVTGNPYNSVMPPAIRSVQGDTIGRLNDGREFDFAQGGAAVAAPIRGLSLAESALDGTVDADAGVAYVEWTVTFRNESKLQREARMQVALPPGAVVSRLTLWIDGKEREAAFGERGQVAAAYQKVVQRRRDPVMVTSSGKDLVMVQCFPVPPDGGVMKARIGITSPLYLASAGEALLRLPFVVERNFGVPDGSRHALRIGADAAMAYPQGKPRFASTGAGDSRVLQGSLGGQDLASPSSIRVTRRPDIARTWTEDPHSAAYVICQEVVARPPAIPQRVIVVVDGSRGMAEYAEPIARAVARLADSLEVSVVMAGDDVVELVGAGNTSRERRDSTARQVAAFGFGGGCDNAQALTRALATAGQSNGAALVWLHGVQPVELSDVHRIADAWKAAPHPPGLYELQLNAGPNVVGSALDAVPRATSPYGFGDPEGDLGRLVPLLSGDVGVLELERTRTECGSGEPQGPHGSPHLARLWANDEVARLLATGTGDDRTNAVRVATGYQLVTPVSGAVVLETEAQFKEAGLKSVDPNSVPVVGTVPEPATWALMILGALIIALSRSPYLRRVQYWGTTRAQG